MRAGTTEAILLLGLAAAGVAMVAVFGAMWVLFVYRNDRYVDIRSRIPRLRVSERA